MSETEQKKKIVYISGPITGVPDYKERFQKAEDYLKAQSYDVVNPAILPECLDYDDLMRACLHLALGCDAIYLLRGWERSRGAKQELSCVLGHKCGGPMQDFEVMLE